MYLPPQITSGALADPAAVDVDQSLGPALLRYKDEPVSLFVWARGNRHWVGMEPDGCERRTGYSRPFIRVTDGGTTGGCPRRNIRSINLVSLVRSLAYQRVSCMAGETDVICSDVTVGGEGAGAYHQREGRSDEQLLHVLYP
jgi:hypothetical protein